VTCTKLFSLSWAVRLLIISTVSAANGRSTFKRKAITERGLKTWASFYVRNSSGNMVPLSAITSIQHRAGPEFTMRYNLYRCAQINASAATGYSSAQAMEALEQVFGQTMPPDMGSTTWVCLIKNKRLGKACRLP